MKETPQKRSDSFFPNEIIEKVQRNTSLNFNTYFRQPTEHELFLLTEEAFELLLFWVNKGDVTIDFFERFMAILLSFEDRIDEPIDDTHLPSMLEMISLVDYVDQVIYTTIELYIISPSLLKRPFEVVH